jgi:lysozyme family protein
MTPLEFLRLVIERWEGGYQSYADDRGNWVTNPGGMRIKIGTMRGVTPEALAKHRGVPAWTLTPDDMKSVTLDEAAEIGLTHYYRAPRFDLLTWGAATASLVDFGWGSGPGQATLSMQRLVGVAADGIIGPVTAKAYGAWATRLGDKAALQAIHDMRAAFYRHIAEINPDNQKFLQGWLNRDDWASCSGNGEFCSKFLAG